MKIFLFLLLVTYCTSEWVKEMENEELFQGDIILDPDEDERGKNGFASIKGGRWPNAKIPYVIDNSISSRGISAIYAAINDYHKYTCIRFNKRTNERSYIKFYLGGGCSSPVGYRSGRVNSVSLARGCWYKGTVMHEIGHSIGLHHEQSRPDRDSYVEIVWNNINSAMRYNFNKQRSSNINSLGTGYDYKSMMHYGKTAFGSGKLTILTKDPEMQNIIGNRKGFSETDIKQINLMYCGGGGEVTPQPPLCEDKNQKCAMWKNRGECYKNPGYMLSYCKKSCKVC